MRNTLSGRRGLPWLLAAVMAVVLSCAGSIRAAEGNAASLLSAELPAGVTLRHASSEQMNAAVRAAVKEHPEMAPNIVRAAILAKSARHEGKEMDNKDGVGAPCGMIVGIVRSAIASAPDKASDITQVALSLDPDCADALNSAIGNGGFGDRSGLNIDNSPDDFYGGFGVGFGPGFPGSPGFTGSPPSGARRVAAGRGNERRGRLGALSFHPDSGRPLRGSFRRKGLAVFIPLCSRES